MIIQRQEESDERGPERCSGKGERGNGEERKGGRERGGGSLYILTFEKNVGFKE